MGTQNICFHPEIRKIFNWILSYLDLYYVHSFSAVSLQDNMIGSFSASFSKETIFVTSC